ncbi:MAG: hypothetical protein EA350_12800 [Gemmatimonadales bacterium]|nr:MAG: hypothetical protein EA350_12800 [Gemmatimonadales bacterium]
MKTVDRIALLGLVALVAAGCAGGAGSAGGSASSAQSVITLEEIEQGRWGNTYELVQSLRPAWLRPRGAQSVGEAARGSGVGGQVSVQAGQDQILVYLDRARLGGPEALRQIDPLNIGSITFLDRAQATYRFGPGHLHGAILLTAR